MRSPSVQACPAALQQIPHLYALFLSCRDTAGSERFQAMTSSYFRGCHGIFLGEIMSARLRLRFFPRTKLVAQPYPSLMVALHNLTPPRRYILLAVFDVTRQETLEALENHWMKGNTRQVFVDYVQAVVPQ